MRKFLYVLGALALLIIAYFVIKHFNVEKVDTFKLEFVQTDPSVNLRRVKQNGKWGLLDETNVPVTNFDYDSIAVFSEKKSVVEKDGKFGFIDGNVNDVTPIKYDLAYDFKDGIARVSINGKWGLINEKGEEILKPNFYDRISPFDYNGIAKAENFEQKVVHYINKSGQVVKK